MARKFEWNVCNAEIAQEPVNGRADTVTVVHFEVLATDDVARFKGLVGRANDKVALDPPPEKGAFVGKKDITKAALLGWAKAALDAKAAATKALYDTEKKAFDALPQRTREAYAFVAPCELTKSVKDYEADASAELDKLAKPAVQNFIPPA